MRPLRRLVRARDRAARRRSFDPTAIAVYRAEPIDGATLIAAYILTILTRSSQMATAEAARTTPYRVKADSIESCSCRHGCNCQFGGVPNEGICEFIIGYDVKDGRVGDVSL